MANRLKEFFTYLRVGKRPDDLEELPITKREDDIVTQIDESEIQQVGQFNQFRQLANDRTTLYDAYDEMKTDSVIAAALEMYADDATTTDEQGRVIWAESEDEDIAKAANRLIDIFELPERAWKHIYQACLYGDYYLKVYRNENEDRDLAQDEQGQVKGQQIRVINDVTEYHGHNEILNYEEYVEDVDDPATIFDLKLKGKTAGYIEVDREVLQNNAANLMTSLMPNSMFVFQLKDIDIYRPDRFVHIMIGENTTRNPETIDVEYGDDYKVTYKSARGKSILQDVYPIQKEIQLLEDTLLVNRLTRSPLIRLLEVELGDMPKKEVNNYLRRIKQLIEQHVSLDKDTGMYRSFNAPGPIDNVIYIPVRNGKGSVSVNNLGGDVNIRDIADIDYFNNKRAGALKIPRAYLGEDMDGCLRGETKLLLLNGQHLTIKDMYEHRDEYLGKGIMSCNPDGEIVPTIIKDIKLTRKDADFVRVHLDNGEYFDVTPDHLVMLRDGTFAEAFDLDVGESLMPLYDKVSKGRRYVWDNKEEVWYPQYRLVAQHKYGELKKGYQVHHINEIKIDDDPSNLEQITFAEHCSKHSIGLHEKAEVSRNELKEKDPEAYYEKYGRGGRALKGVKKSAKTKRKISKALKGKPSNHPFEKGELNPVHNITEETRKKISIANKGRKHTEETKRKIGNAHRGKVVSEDTRRKLSENHVDVSGSKNPMYGRSVEWTEERRSTQSKRISGKGNPCYGKKLVNNGLEQKYVLKEDVDLFLLENPSWELGGLKQNAPHNHKVVKVEYLEGIIEDAYDIEVENECPTFILDAGVFVHNSGLSNGGSLTRLSIRYARTIKRIQQAYIRAITTLINLYFVDKKLDYVNKFQVRMTSPSTQEDLERNELINGNIDLVSNIMDLTSSLEGDTQKKILNYLVANVMKMPDIAEMINEDGTPEEDINIEGGGGSGGAPDIDIDMGGGDTADMSDAFEETGEESGEEDVEGTEGGFTDEDYASFEDELPNI